MESIFDGGKDEIYVAVISSTGDKVQVAYETSLPVKVRDYGGFNVVRKLVGAIEGKSDTVPLTVSEGDTALHTYGAKASGVDRAFADEDDDEYWISWLEDHGYDEFVSELQQVVDQEGKANILGSFQELTNTELDRELEKYSWELEWQGERKPGERSF